MSDNIPMRMVRDPKTGKLVPEPRPMPAAPAMPIEQPNMGRIDPRLYE